MKLRDYQLETQQKIRERYQAGVTRQLVKKATGLGKTVDFAALPDAMGFPGRTLVLDHRTELTNQALDKVKMWNPTRSCGVEMGPRESLPFDDIVVAGVQTIGRKNSPRLTKFDPAKFSLLVIDEAHHATAQSYRTVIDHFTQNPKLLLVGFTATPNRADGKGLGEIFTEIVDDKGILWGIQNGWLADIKGIRVKTDVDLSHVGIKAGDFNTTELGAKVDTTERNKIVVEAFIEHAQGRKGLFFAVDVKHAQNLATMFNRYNVPAEAVWGGDPEREAKLANHRSGNLQVIVNCELLTEGYDDWTVSCVGMARPTQSEGLFTQCVGRGTRIPSDIDNLKTARKNGQFIAKDDCILLDFVDVTQKHSLVTLPTLFGMGPNTNLRGMAITKVVAAIEQAKLRNPLLDLSVVEDINKLQSYVEQVDLFKVSFPPEIIQISDYQWHKTGENAYVLALTKGETVVVIRDMLEKWHIRGMVNECVIKDVRPSLETAIHEADFKVGLLGGRGIKSLVSRETKWGKDEPTPAQRIACSRLRIVIPPGATKGEVSQKMTAKILELKQQQAQQGRRIA